VLWQLDLDGTSERSLINLVLCFALLLTAMSLIFRKTDPGALIAGAWRAFETGTTTVATRADGSSAWRAGFDFFSLAPARSAWTALLLLYPRLPMASIVGSDIAHAVPLTLVAGIGHWALGDIDWHLMGVLLMGSLPGIVVGSYGRGPRAGEGATPDTGRNPDRGLRQDRVRKRCTFSLSTAAGVYCAVIHRRMRVIQ